MLILSRNVGERVRVGPDLWVTAVAFTPTVLIVSVARDGCEPVRVTIPMHGRVEVAPGIVMVAVGMFKSALRLGFEASREVVIHREEVLERIAEVARGG